MLCPFHYLSRMLLVYPTCIWTIHITYKTVFVYLHHLTAVRYMADKLPIRRKTLFNQLINLSFNTEKAYRSDCRWCGYSIRLVCEGQTFASRQQAINPQEVVIIDSDISTAKQSATGMMILEEVWQSKDPSLIKGH